MSDERIEERIEVVRSVELDVGAAEAWEMIGDGDRWAEWMVDDATVEVAPGAAGEVVESGRSREVHVDEVVGGERVAFTWWPADRPDQASSVVLRLLWAPEVAVLEIVETFPARAVLAASVAEARWSARAVRMVARRLVLLAA